MLAVLNVVRKFNATQRSKIKTIYVPGMCTGCGRMPFSTAVDQMMEAIVHWDSSSPENDFEAPLFIGETIFHSLDLSNQKIIKIS